MIAKVELATPTRITLPRRQRGRQTTAAEARYQAELVRFCAAIRQIQSRLDFRVSSRGWCYLLEPYGLGKGDFDKAQRVINDARKSGDLPLDICAEDSDTTANLEEIDEASPDDYGQEIVNSTFAAHQWYRPFSFWRDQDFYLQMLVEKIDLLSLFEGVCAEFHVPIANAHGWSNLNRRVEFMLRFKKWEAEHKQCVLLWCGDHDPGGLHISNRLYGNLKELARAVGWHPRNLTIKRFGLNYDFIERHGLTWIENLETSSGRSLDDEEHPQRYAAYVQRYLRDFGARKVEANALVVEPEAGRELCRQAILEYVPKTAPAIYRRKLNVEREMVRVAVLELLERQTRA
jgi:hypothetical protein